MDSYNGVDESGVTALHASEDGIAGCRPLKHVGAVTTDSSTPL